MPDNETRRKAVQRKYTPAQLDQAVRRVRQLRKELGTEHGTVCRLATELGYGAELR